jgi:hypothetical protein
MMAKIKTMLLLSLLLACTACTDQGQPARPEPKEKWRKRRCAVPWLFAVHRDTIFVGDTLSVLRSKHRDTLRFVPEEPATGYGGITATHDFEMGGDKALEEFTVRNGALVSYTLTITVKGDSANARGQLKKHAFLLGQLSNGNPCEGTEKSWSFNKDLVEGNFETRIRLVVF